jgi:DNA-binding response OmpR family regulator
MTSRGHILLIEDEPAFLDLLGTFLRTQGYQVEAAVDGQTAVRCLLTKRFDLILTDLCMPRYDGLELLAHLRKTRCSVPVVAMSGGAVSSKVGLLRAARLLGARVTLHKPFGLRELEAAIAGVLEANEKTPSVLPAILQETRSI